MGKFKPNDYEYTTKHDEQQLSNERVLELREKITKRVKEMEKWIKECMGNVLTFD